MNDKPLYEQQAEMFADLFYKFDNIIQNEFDSTARYNTPYKLDIQVIRIIANKFIEQENKINSLQSELDAFKKLHSVTQNIPICNPCKNNMHEYIYVITTNEFKCKYCGIPQIRDIINFSLELSNE